MISLNAFRNRSKRKQERNAQLFEQARVDLAKQRIASDYYDQPEIVEMAVIPLHDALFDERGPLPFVPGLPERITCAAEEADADEHAAGIVTHPADEYHAGTPPVRPAVLEDGERWDADFDGGMH